MITLTIDGQSVNAKRGENLLHCATQSGIAIPNLCHQGKQAEGRKSCDLCYVETTDCSGNKTTIKLVKHT